MINYRSHPEGAQATLAQVEATEREGHIVQADLGVFSDDRRLGKKLGFWTEIPKLKRRFFCKKIRFLHKYQKIL